jgi:hypothetical protein
MPVAANAHRRMVEAVFESTAVRITFANGDRFRFPLVRLGAPGSLQIKRASIAPDGMSLEIPVARGEEKVELPWDLVRAECDPDFADHVRASVLLPATIQPTSWPPILATRGDQDQMEHPRRAPRPVRLLRDAPLRPWPV